VSCDPIVVIHHLFPSFGRFEYGANLPYRFLGQKTVHGHHVESERLYVSHKRRVPVDQQRFAEVDRFEKRISEAFVAAGVCDEICIWVNVPKGASAFTGDLSGPRACDVTTDQPQIHSMFAGITLEPFRIFQLFITGLMGNHQFVSRIVKLLDQLDGRFDAFSLYDAGRLQDHSIFRRQSDRLPKCENPFVVRIRGVFEVEHIRDDRILHAGAKGQLFLGVRVDHDVFDIWQPGGKGHAQIVADGIEQESNPFPVEIMIVGYGGKLCFGDGFRQCQAEGNVHRNGQYILGDQQIDVVAFDKLVELNL